MPEPTSDAAPLTVVLVHGAYADASSRKGVVERLQAAGLHVTAPANPLRGIAIDSAYTASFLKQIPGGETVGNERARDGPRLHPGVDLASTGRHWCLGVPVPAEGPARKSQER